MGTKIFLTIIKEQSETQFYKPCAIDRTSDKVQNIRNYAGFLEDYIMQPKKVYYAENYGIFPDYILV